MSSCTCWKRTFCSLIWVPNLWLQRDWDIIKYTIWVEFSTLLSMLNIWAFCTHHSHEKLEECRLTYVDLFRVKVNFNYQFRSHFLQKLVKGICQAVHFIHWTEEACFRPDRTKLVEETVCLCSLALHWSSIMTRIPLCLSPTAFSVESRLLNSFSSHCLWAGAHGDRGWVIVTVPALGCPRVLKWDLTRHGLSSLPYSPDTGGRVGKAVRRGWESLAVDFLCFIQTFVKTTVDWLLSDKQPTLLYNIAQETVLGSYLRKQQIV